MEETNIEKYIITDYSAEIAPVVVLTGTAQEYQQFLDVTKRRTSQAIAIRQPYQFEFYPNLDVVHYGTFWLNEAYNSQEYQDKIKAKQWEEFERKENERNSVD